MSLVLPKGVRTGTLWEYDTHNPLRHLVATERRQKQYTDKHTYNPMNRLDRNHSRLNNLTKHVQKKHKHTFRYHRNINLSGVVTWSHCSEHCCTDSRKWTKDSDSVLCWAVQPWNRTRYRPVGPTRAQQVDNLAGTWSSGHCRWRQLCSLLLLLCPWGLEYLTNMKQPPLHSAHTHTPI